MGAQCFMVTDTQRVKLSLRRFVWSKDAPCISPRGYHNAAVEIGEAPEVVTPDGYLQDLTTDYPQSDTRWPTMCDGCTYIFQVGDQWQVNQATIYAADGSEWIDQDLPPGAIREAWWLGAGHQGPDGKCYLLRLPNGGIDWSIYGPASDSTARWTVTGTLPNITASPSINAEGIWHGWLNNGVLTP